MSLVTITRTMGCGSGVIGHKVAEELGFELYNDERFREEAIKLGITSNEVTLLDEKRPGFLDRLFNHRPKQFHELMESLVYEMATRGSAVIVGHASQVLLHDFDCAFHVLCICSEASRIKRLMAKTGISEQKATEIVRKADLSRDDFMRNTYQLNWKDASLYEVVINTDKLGGEYAADLIITMVRERISDCSLDSLDAMARLALKKKAKSKLMEYGININLIYVEVPKQGKIYVGGIAASLEDAGKIKEMLKGMKGVKEVISEISVY